jgi:16S rRNA (uracil1498-N3)-methyltransferase
MRRLRFLVAPGALDAGRGARVPLPSEEAHHLRASLRASAGTPIHLFDGAGTEYRAEVREVTAGLVEAVLLEQEVGRVESPLRIVLYQALTREESFERALGQATELGVAAIVPLLAERSLHAGRDAGARRSARWARIAGEAAKLSWRRVVPSIGRPVEISAIPPASEPGVVGIALYPEAPAGSFRKALEAPPPREVGLAVGPEGGFSPGEIEQLTAGGYAVASLGPRVLRTEHAGPAAIAAILARWGDLG